MNLLVMGLVLGAAFSHALWNMLLKKSENRLLMMTAMHSMTGIMGLIFLPFLGTIHTEAWNLLLVSVAVHGGYYVFLTYSYRHIELGQAYPIMRGSGPLIVFLASWIFLDEAVPDHQILAFFLVAGGILSLGMRSMRSFLRHPQSLFFAVGTGMFIGSYTMIDGMGVRSSGNVWAYICWLFFLEMVMVQIYCVYHYRGRTLAGLRSLGSSGIWAGILSAYAYGSVLWAYTSSPIMLVSALRETSVVMASLLGIVFLKENKDLFKIFAAVLVTAGIIFIKN